MSDYGDGQDYEDEDYEFNSEEELKDDTDNEKPEGEDDESEDEDDENMIELSPSVQKVYTSKKLTNKFITKMEEPIVIGVLAQRIIDGHEFTEEQEEILDVWNESRPEHIAIKWFYNRDLVPYTVNYVRKSKNGGNIQVSTDDLRILIR